VGDMVSIDRHADAAVGARLRKGWNKSRQLVPLLTNTDVSLRVREVIQKFCATLHFKRQ